jgi:ABC-2 type transport system permease protein
VILLPILLAYGFAASMSWAYFFMIPIAILLAPVLPFFIASVVMYPLQRIANFLRNKSNLTTLLYLGGLIAMIFVYMQLIDGVLKVLMDNEGIESAIANPDTVDSIRRIGTAFFPQWLFSNLFDSGFGTLLWSLVVLVLFCGALLVGAYFIAGYNYKKTYMDERNTYQAVRKKSPFKQGKPLFATIRKDILQISRSPNYTFQFLLLIVLCPLLVYFCNRVSMFTAYQEFMNIRDPEKAVGVVYGASMLVIMLLMPLASSFAASSITREGYNVYHTKLIPVSFRRQITVKAMIVFIPVLISIIVSVAMVVIPYKGELHADPLAVSGADAMNIFGVAICMAIGYISLGMYLDLRKPLCNQIGTGELTKSTAHINLIMVVGIIVGSLFGILAMLGAFTEYFGLLNLGGFANALMWVGENSRVLYLPVAAVFAVVCAGLLFIDGPRRYQKLEQ